MLSPQRALLCNLNHIHLQHVSLGLHLSRRPELREGPLSTPPPPGDTGGKESGVPCSGTLVDANSNSPAVPCRCCREHGPELENRPGETEEEEEGVVSPSDPGCSSSLSTCSDLTPDESPVSVYSRDFPPEETNPQPSIIPLDEGSPLTTEGPDCSPDSFCCSPDSCSGASSPSVTGLDSNCNALPSFQDHHSSVPREEEERRELELALETDNGKIDASGKNGSSWKVIPSCKVDPGNTDSGWKTDSGWQLNGNSDSTTWKTSAENTDSNWKLTEKNTDSGWKIGSGYTESSWKPSTGNTESAWKLTENTDSGITDSTWKTSTENPDSSWKANAGKIEGDVSGEPVPHRTITSFHELAQKRKRGSGLLLPPQAKKDRSDWLIIFSPDTELPPSGALNGSPAPPREVTTFKELRSRNRAPPPPVPPRDPPAGWALVPPRPPPPPVPPRRKKTRLGLQPIAEGRPGDLRPESPVAADDVPIGKEPARPREAPDIEAGPLLLPRPLVFRFSADGRPLLEGAGAGGAGSLLLAPLAGWPGPGLRLLGGPSPTEEQLLPVRLSPVGAYSPPARGALPCLASPELALLLSPLFPRSSTFPSAVPPPRQVAAPLPPPPQPKAPRRPRSPPPPPRLLRSSWSFAGVPGAQCLWMAEAKQGSGQLQEEKKGLLIAVSASVDKIISHFGAARNLVQKAQLGDSRLSPDVGHLVLTTLCPALHALVADGLKPFRKDLITGQRRSSPWSVVEASVKPASCTHSLGNLYNQVSRLSPLSSSRSRFHAFILGLLNTKQLELWFSNLQEDTGLLSLLYLPTAFFSLARGGCPSLSTELLLLLQPLSVLTFHLDLLFEHHHHLPLGPPQPPAPPGPPPALQQTVQAVLGWGERLAQSLRGGPGEAPRGPSPSSGWWEQLTQASRVYASGGSEGFPLPRWGSRKQAVPPESTKESRPSGEEPGQARGVWLGRLFGVPAGTMETDGGGPIKSRRPSSWLPPAVSVLALVRKGGPPEPSSPPEELEAPAPREFPTQRAVRALCDHTAAAPDQLSFRRGEVLRVVSTVDEDWLRCGREGAEGLVPVGYTSLIL